uniref:Uncharacterized protein n=3 Tax=Avena sativa TaxID=4498 RepID=A0ACD5VDZ9_AVESA
MASRRQTAAGASNDLAQEHKGDARLVRTTKATVAEPPVAGSRRALVEVGNVINGRPAQADPSRHKGVAAVAADKCVKAIKQQKENNRVKPQVIAISSDSENEKKNPAKRAASQRAPINTLTKILNKCSRASDGVICSPKKAPGTYNIDASDAHNELAVVDYVEDIYRFYKSTEGTCRPLCTYMSSQTDINERMRAILVDWLIEVHYKLMLMPETLYLTVYIIDQYLSMENVPRKELQLVGVSAMLIASKYGEIWAPLVKDLLCISYNSFTREQVLSKEKSILNKLQWNLTVPTMYMFIVRYLKAAMGDRKLENMAFFYAELSLVQYTMLLYAPSVTAAAAVYAARCTLNMSPLWSDILEHHTGLAEWQLLDPLTGCPSHPQHHRTHLASLHPLRPRFRSFPPPASAPEYILVGERSSVSPVARRLGPCLADEHHRPDPTPDLGERSSVSPVARRLGPCLADEHHRPDPTPDLVPIKASPATNARYTPKFGEISVVLMPVIHRHSSRSPVSNPESRSHAPASTIFPVSPPSGISPPAQDLWVWAREDGHCLSSQAMLLCRFSLSISSDQRQHQSLC